MSQLISQTAGPAGSVMTCGITTTSSSSSSYSYSSSSSASFTAGSSATTSSTKVGYLSDAAVVRILIEKKMYKFEVFADQKVDPTPV